MPPKSKAHPTSADIERVPIRLADCVGVRARHLTKVYDRDVLALDDFSAKIYMGEISAILGHNGAGKTTFLDILTGLIRPTSGYAVLLGTEIRRPADLAAVRGDLGVCYQEDLLWETLTVREHLLMYGRLRGLTRLVFVCLFCSFLYCILYNIHAFYYLQIFPFYKIYILIFANRVFKKCLQLSIVCIGISTPHEERLTDILNGQLRDDNSPF